MANPKQKKRNNRNKGKTSASDTLPDLKALTLTDDGKQVTLPSEIFGVVAEFLAGIHAFGSLASLNVANRFIRHETTPVLYETFLRDNLHASVHYRGVVVKPQAFKHTKFYVCHRGTKVIPFEQRSTMFPNLVMTIENVRQTRAGGYSLHLDIHKPLSTATAFGIILKTPIRHHAFSHKNCDTAVTDIVGGAPYNADACAAEDAKPDVRLPLTLATIRLEPRAYLIGDRDGSRATWTTDIRLHHLRFPEVNQLEDEKESLDTIVELLKLVERPATKGYLQTFDTALTAPQACRARTLYVQWHIDLTFTPHGFVAFTDVIKDLLFLHPKIHLNRMKLLVGFALPREPFRSICSDLFPFLINSTSAANYSFGIGPNHAVLALASCFAPDETTGIPTRHIGFVCAKAEVDGKVSFTDNVFTEARGPGAEPREHEDFGRVWEYYENMPRGPAVPREMFRLV